MRDTGEWPGIGQKECDDGTNWPRLATFTHAAVKAQDGCCCAQGSDVGKVWFMQLVSYTCVAADTLDSFSVVPGFSMSLGRWCKWGGCYHQLTQKPVGQRLMKYERIHDESWPLASSVVNSAKVVCRADLCESPIPLMPIC